MKKVLQILILILMPLFTMAQTTIFTENCGNPAATTSAATYTGWQNNGVLTYTASATYPDVRTSTPSTGYTSASGNGNIYFNATSVIGTSGTINVVISNINTSSYTNLVLSLGFLKTNNAWANEVVIEVSSNGTTWTSLVMSPSTGSGTASVWQLLTASGSIPSTTNLRIRFRYASTSSTNTVRIDDIKLVGCLIPSSPTPTYTTPTCSSSVVSLPSNSYIELNSGDTSKSVSTTISSSGTYYARTVSVVAGCTSVWSSATSFSVVINTPSPTITINPVSFTASHIGSHYQFIAHANYSFLWQLSTNGGSTWNNLTISSPYNTNGDTLKIYPVSRTMNTYKYRIASTNGACVTNSSVATLTTSATLPIKLIYFYGDNGGSYNQLKWSTASEIDNEKFEIERSDSSLNWVKIGDVMGLGNTTEEVNYYFYDTKPIFGSNYYRLKQIDFEGNFVYYGILSINCSTKIDIKYYDALGREVNELRPNTLYFKVFNGYSEKFMYYGK